MLAIACALGAMVPTDIAAHDTSARIDLDPASVAAGGVLVVRAVELGGDGAVPILLVDAAGNRRPLGQAVADATGAIGTPIVVPVDLTPGPYTVRLIAPDGDEVDAAIVIEAAILGRGDQPGQDEPLQAPATAVRDRAIPSGRDVLQPSPVPVSDGLGRPPTSLSPDPYPLLAASLAVVAVALLVVRARHPSRPR